jgi:two-component system, NtrC family, nitrogen regulation response regulator GlnG
MSAPNILIVEDDTSIGIVITAALEAEGISSRICDSASSRDDALSEMRFDLMITDVVLKDSDGLATLADVKANYPDMPVIVISAQNSLETAVRASEIDAFEYFPKPFDLNELVVAVKQGIERRKYSPAHSEGMSEVNMPMIGRSVWWRGHCEMICPS